MSVDNALLVGSMFYLTNCQSSSPLTITKPAAASANSAYQETTTHLGLVGRGRQARQMSRCRFRFYRGSVVQAAN